MASTPSSPPTTTGSADAPGATSTGSSVPCLVSLSVEQPDDYAAVDRDCFRSPVLAQDGERIGRVSAVVAGSHGQPRWFVVATGLLRSADVAVPVEGVVRTDAGLEVPFTGDVIRSAPRIDPDVPPGPEAQTAVDLHYAVAGAAAGRGRAERPQDDFEDVAELWPAPEVAVHRSGRRGRRWLRRQLRTAS